MIRSILNKGQYDPKLIAITNNSRRVIGQIQEECNTAHAAVLFEVSCEESTCLQVDTHSTEDDREVVLVPIVNVLCWPHQASLSANLSGDLVMWKTGRREDRNLLTTSNRVHGVDRRDTSRNHFLRVDL